MRYDQGYAFAAGVSDDDLCHCGRLKRYKNCCKQHPVNELESRIQKLDLTTRSRLTVEAVRYFLYSGSSADPYGQRSLTTDSVSNFYRYLSDLWPHRLKALDALRTVREEQSLSGYYVGDPRPETILHNVARLSLYADRIFVEQPFYMPWSLRDEYDPVTHPGPVMQDTRKWAVATLLMQPWIDAGMIEFVPDPSDFNQPLREAFWASGKRREAEGKIRILPEDLAMYKEFFKRDWLRQLYSLTDDEIVARMRASIGLSERDVPRVLEYIYGERDRDPLYVANAAEHNPLMRVQVPTIEQTILSCGLTGAFPFTDQRGKWLEITENLETLPADAETWSPLTRAFSECNLEFLNIEDARLAYRIRDEGYLKSFRAFLRDLWKAIGGAEDERHFSALARDFGDRLRDEHRVATTEWGTIHAKFDAAIQKSAVTTAFAGVTAALTSLGVLGIALSFGTHALFSHGEAKKLNAELANFRARVPLSIFIDLVQ
jgi:hypothetical protein